MNGIHDINEILGLLTQRINNREGSKEHRKDANFGTPSIVHVFCCALKDPLKSYNSFYIPAFWKKREEEKIVFWMVCKIFVACVSLKIITGKMAVARVWNTSG